MQKKKLKQCLFSIFHWLNIYRKWIFFIKFNSKSVAIKTYDNFNKFSKQKFNIHRILRIVDFLIFRIKKENMKRLVLNRINRKHIFSSAYSCKTFDYSCLRVPKFAYLSIYLYHVHMYIHTNVRAGMKIFTEHCS